VILVSACGLDERQPGVATVDALEPGASFPTTASPNGTPGGSSADAGDPELAAATEAPCLDCIVRECDPGASVCDSATELAECGATGSWTAASTCTFVCANAACVGECSPAATECVTTIRYRQCSADGAWSEPIDCENACVGTGCAGECKPAVTRCISTTEVQTCSDQGAWLPAAVCQNACSGNACTGECTPGSTHCATDTQLQTCNELEQWVLAEACPLACVGAACGGECAPGSRRCGQGGLPQLCVSGVWQDEADCPFVCVGNGSCGGECTPGSRRCNPATGIPQQCGTNALWQNQTPCDFVCTGEGSCTGECLPNSRRCSSSGRPQVCSNAFQWLDESQCPFVCTGNGACTGECQNGQRRCGPTGVPQQCVNFTWQNQSACGVSQVCQGQGARGCAQGLTSCSVGSCTELTEDANNCGQCGRSCGGGQCSNGACQALELASGQAPILESDRQQLVVDSTHVYWMNRDATRSYSMRRVPKNGGDVQTIVPTQQETDPGGTDVAQNLAVEANRLIWITRATMFSTRLTMTSATPFLAGRIFTGALTSSDGFVYFSEFGPTNTRIVRRSINANGASGADEILHSETATNGTAHRVKVVDDCAYFAIGQIGLGGTAVRRACAGATASEELFFINTTTIEGLDADQTGVYISRNFVDGNAQIIRLPITPGQSTTLLSSTTEFMRGMAIDVRSAYFVENSTGTIARVPKTGGNRTVFATPVVRGANPFSLVTDDAAVYWLDDGRILKKAQ
jgi:hypothetical protein